MNDAIKNEDHPFEGFAAVMQDITSGNVPESQIIANMGITIETNKHGGVMLKDGSIVLKSTTTTCTISPAYAKTLSCSFYYISPFSGAAHIGGGGFLTAGKKDEVGGYAIWQRHIFPEFYDIVMLALEKLAQAQQFAQEQAEKVSDSKTLIDKLADTVDGRMYMDTMT